MSMTRKEHLAWCKRRALEYVEIGELAQAVASMTSDMGKHPDTRMDPALAQLGIFEVMTESPAGVRRWIEGFN